MQPTRKLLLSAVVNWSISRQLIDQFPAAVVVINCPPFRGTIDRLPPSPASLATAPANSQPKVGRCHL